MGRAGQFVGVSTTGLMNEGTSRSQGCASSPYFEAVMSLVNSSRMGASMLMLVFLSGAWTHCQNVLGSVLGVKAGA